jgi:ligand-binding sensor domain-containing protein
MKRSPLLTIAFFLLFSYSSAAQEYSYTHYDIKDGLAGSNVYCITQDKKGFLWMGTDGGLSRFDGTHFKNFTLGDGLPDIEVLQIFADSRDRIWMGPFSKSICYYQNGKIHNQVNDGQLAHIHLKGNIHSFAEDKYGNILVAENKVIHLITIDGHVGDYDSIDGEAINCAAISLAPDGNFLVESAGKIFHFSNGKFSLVMPLRMDHWYHFKLGASSVFFALNQQMIIWRKSMTAYSLCYFQSGKTVDFIVKGAMNHVSFSLMGDSLAYRNEPDGTTEFNTRTGGSRKFNLGAYVTKTFRDSEGNTWFTSLGQGIFRLNSDEFKNITLSLPSTVQCVPQMMVKMDGDLWVGTNYNGILQLSLPAMQEKATYVPAKFTIGETRFIGKRKDGKFLVGTTSFLYDAFFSRRGLQSRTISVKEGIFRNDSEFVAGGAYGVFLIDANDLHTKDTLFRERATTIHDIDGALYVGTINGLYVIKSDRTVEYWGANHPNLRVRISAIQSASNRVIWIATYGAGICGYKDGNQVAVITSKQGLSSDICRTIRLDGNTLWVGTDKGLNKVDLAKTGYPVVAIYNGSDGLGSDIVNTILTDSGLVYVGTPAGLSLFNSARVNESSSCHLVLTGITNAGKDRMADTASLVLNYSQNNIRFDFAGISFKSAGKILYRYRLLGLDSTWKTMTETFLDYPTLPYKDYILQLQAINKFGKVSNTVSVQFVVATPYWKTIWFDVMILALFLLLTWYFVSLRVTQLRRRQAQREEMIKRMTEMEHMALQAQMNPHFIFNCLNSIQQYIFDQDIQVANKYISGFARLIRATFNNSSKTYISLAEEMDYISSYLSLERLRFKEKMDYAVEVEPSLREEVDNIHIPPMLIQPYIENSMRHGLRHRTGGGGYIQVHVTRQSNDLVFVVEDNGIGREQASRYKTREHIEYQSRGMSLTADRIRLINMNNGSSIRVRVIDLKNSQGEAAGTRVEIRFQRYDNFQEEA